MSNLSARPAGELRRADRSRRRAKGKGRLAGRAGPCGRSRLAVRALLFFLTPARPPGCIFLLAERERERCLCLGDGVVVSLRHLARWRGQDLLSLASAAAGDLLGLLLPLSGARAREIFARVLPGPGEAELGL